MGKSYRIFLQALVLSFLGHAMFFSLFNVQDLEFERKGQLLPMTILQMHSRTAGRVEPATSSNPELIDPKLVQLAEKVKRTTSPKLESHRKAIVWEEEMTVKSFEPDILSWLVWSFRRDIPHYSELFEDPAVFASPYDAEAFAKKTEERSESASSESKEILISFSGRKLLQSNLPKLSADMQSADAASIRLKVGISREGKVRFVLPETGSASMLSTIAANEVRKWRFSPAVEFDENESSENIEWGWIIVPFEKESSPDTIMKNGGIENTEANEQ